MALTKGKIAELIQELKGGGDPGPDTKYHDLVVWEICDIVLNDIIMINFRENKRAGDYDINSEFIKTFEDEPVLFDKNRNERYTKLPARILSLPGDRGLRMVAPMESQRDQFDIVRSGSVSVWEHLEADSLTGPEVYIEGNKIYYRKLTRHVKSVLIKMVASVEGLEEDDPLPIPSGYEKMFLDGIREILQEPKSTVEDKTNDSRNQETQLGG